MNKEELLILQKSLIDLIEDYIGDNDELNYFTESILVEGLDLSELYIAALYNNKFELADLIIQSERYDIQHDKKLQVEFFNWGNTYRDECIEKCLVDGFIPDAWTTMDIMNLLNANRKDTNRNLIYNMLLLLLRAYKIKKIIARIRASQ